MDLLVYFTDKKIVNDKQKTEKHTYRKSESSYRKQLQKNYKTNNYKINNYKINNYKINNYKINNYKTNNYKTNNYTTEKNGNVVFK